MGTHFTLSVELDDSTNLDYVKSILERSDLADQFDRANLDLTGPIELRSGDLPRTDELTRYEVSVQFGCPGPDDESIRVIDRNFQRFVENSIEEWGVESCFESVESRTIEEFTIDYTTTIMAPDNHRAKSRAEMAAGVFSRSLKSAPEVEATTVLGEHEDQPDQPLEFTPDEPSGSSTPSHRL